MKKLLVGLAAVPFLAGAAMAGQPMPLSDAQMDKVTAGYEANVFAGVVNLAETNQYLELSFPPLTLEALKPLSETGPETHGGVELIFQTMPPGPAILGS
jgi:hypothetical protein